MQESCTRGPFSVAHGQHVQNRGTRRQRSVGLDLAEAVGAVDRPVHPRLERHLGLVAARRADDRKIFARRPVVAALVAARAADLADVVAGIPSGTPAGPAARAALRIRREPLLCVELLVGRGEDELNAAIDAAAVTIGVDYERPP